MHGQRARSLSRVHVIIELLCGTPAIRPWQGSSSATGVMTPGKPYGASSTGSNVSSVRLTSFSTGRSSAPGDKFPQVLEHRLAESEVLIAVIGPRWLTIADDQGRPRLWAEQDYVAYEVSSALSRTTRVIPVLVDGARMPAREELPPALSALADNQALPLDDAHFRH